MGFRRRSGFVSAAGLVVLIGAVAQAASDRLPPTRFDDRIKHREGGAISVLPKSTESLPPFDELRTRWEQFQERNGGGWTVYLDDRTALPSLVSGRGLAWLPAEAPSGETLDVVDRSAREFLAKSTSLLGDWSDILELDRAASQRLRDGHWQIVYRQRIDGVRVENARLDLHVVHGRMVLMGAENWARPRTSGVPVIGVEQARLVLEAYLGDDAGRVKPGGEPQLVMIALDAQPADGESRPWSGTRGEGLKHALVWRFALAETEAPVAWVGEVDARDGSISAFYESTEYASMRGGVFPIGPDGDCANGGCEASNFPMPFADFTEATQPTQFGDDYGNLICVDPGATFTTNLSGRYVRITDVCGAVSELGTCASGVDLGLKAGENCSVAPGASPGNTGAARTAYYHVNRVAEVARFYDPGNAWLQSPLTANVNVNSNCNANWDGTKINMFRAGSGCANTGENAGILVHEWGHGYNVNDGGGLDRPSEAYSDIVAILSTRASCMGRGNYTGGGTCSGYGDTCLTCTGFRDFDWSARQSHTPATPTNFVFPHCSSDASTFGGPCNREAHCESYVSSEAIYDLATRDLPAAGMNPDSAWQLVDRLWYTTRPGSGGNAYSCAIPLSNSCGATSWYQRMRVADDDDGNLANGTPHAAAIFAAFQRHAIACGAAADATNQNHSSCPTLAAPVLTRSTTPSGIQLSWTAVAGAAEYRVYRGELGCNRQQVPIASLPAGQTTYVDNSGDSDVIRQYRVEAFGTNRACASPVSNCALAPPGSRLQVTSHRVVDDGDGIPEPGETITLPVSILNSGAEAAPSASGTLQLFGPADVRILEPGATWSTIAASSTVESSAPHFQLVVLPEASCGDTLTVDVSGASPNSSPFTAQIAIPMGNPHRDYTETSIVIVPSFTTTPAQAQFVIADDREVADLDLTIDIFHQDPTQIIVELTSPQGTTVRLHDRGAGSGHGIETRFDRDTAPSGPGTMADFIGESTMGTWTISMQDVDPTGVTTDGYIRTRTLNATIVGGFGCTPQSCVDPTPAAAPDLRVASVDDGSQLDLALSWSAVSGSGYHVLQSGDPRFRDGVALIGNPATATSMTLQDGAQSTPPLTFFQVRAVNNCHFEGP
jgi:subtilisin-like proprotein convertase family protein